MLIKLNAQNSDAQNNIPYIKSLCQKIVYPYPMRPTLYGQLGKLHLMCGNTQLHKSELMLKLLLKRQASFSGSFLEVLVRNDYLHFLLCYLGKTNTRIINCVLNCA